MLRSPATRDLDSGPCFLELPVGNANTYIYTSIKYIHIYIYMHMYAYVFIHMYIYIYMYGCADRYVITVQYTLRPYHQLLVRLSTPTPETPRIDSWTP